MARETGVLRKKADNAFGHVSRPSGPDAFVPPPEIRKHGLKDGAELEFEVIDDPKKPGSFMAVNITVKKQPDAPAPSKPTQLGVDFLWGNPQMLDIDQGGGVSAPQLILPVWIVVKEGTEPKPGVEVIMEPDGINTVYSADVLSTTAKGLTFFQIQLPPDAAQASVTARVAGSNYSEFWQKVPDAATASKPAEPKKPDVAKAIKVFELGTDDEGYALFRVLTLSADTADALGVSDVVVAESAQELIGLEPGDDSPMVSRGLEFATNNQGWNMPRLKPAKAGEAEVYFRLTRNPTKAAGPFKVKRLETAPVDTANKPATQPAVPKFQRLNHIRGVYTFCVEARTNADLVAESEIDVEWRRAGSNSSWGTTPVQIGDNGSVNVEVRVVKNGERGDAFFVADCLRSKPAYLVHPMKPVRAEKK